MAAAKGTIDCTANLSAAEALAAYRHAGWSARGDAVTVRLDLGSELVAVILESVAAVKVLDRLEGANGTLPATIVVGGPGALRARLYRCRGTLATALNLHGTADGIHVWGTGRELLIPPSTTASERVVWVRGHAPASLDPSGIPLLPDWLDEMVRSPNAARTTWNAALAPPTETLARTDYGNAERLVRRHGADLRYCQSLHAWLCWDGTRWRRDETGEVMRRAKDTVRQIGAEAAGVAHEETRRALLKHALASESASRITAMAALAESEAGIPVTSSELDPDPWLLNVENGTLDLRADAPARLRPPRREDLCTKRAPVAWDPGAACPIFDAFLERVQPDVEVRACLLRLLGYALTGVIREHVLPIHHGLGGNGKGTMTDTILALLGDYAAQVPTELLMEKHGDAHPVEKTTLRGLRFAAASETSKGRALEEAQVKLLTGGDAITARGMRENFYTFQPTHKLWISTNHRPVIRETTHAMWRRVLLFPWNTTIAVGEEDAGLKAKMLTEAPGILRRLVAGCIEWQAQGIDPPPAVRVATEEYRQDSDWLGEFLGGMTTTSADPAAPHVPVKVMAGALYRAYQDWCRGAGHEPRTQTAFGLSMREKQVPKKEVGGYPYYLGVRLRTSADGNGQKTGGRDDEGEGVEGSGGVSGFIRARNVVVQSIGETVQNCLPSPDTNDEVPWGVS